MEAYVGRLGFDPDSRFHCEMVTGTENRPVLLDDGTWGNEVVTTLVPGRNVVTDDDGKTWRIAEPGDTPHNDRYQTGVAAVDSTANQLDALAYEHGRDAAVALVEPHHFKVQPEDPHFDGLKFDDDAVAATITSHTEAYA